MKLVRLEQYYMGNTYSTTKYVYRASDNIKLGDLVSGSQYIGVVIEDNVKPVLELNKYKDTYPCSREEAFKFLKETYLAKDANEYYKEYEKMRQRGGYEDPNYGWVSAYEMDDYGCDYEPTDPHNQIWAEKFANRILEKWKVA